jgi:outer membrane protein TolC
MLCGPLLGYAQATDTRLGLLEACQRALEANLQLALQRQQLQASRGALMQNRGAFDTVLNSSLSSNRKLSPLTEEIQQATGLPYLRNETVQGEVGFSRLLRSGIRMAPTLQFSHASDNQSQPVPVDTATVNLQVIFPLARNRGNPMASIKEQAASLEEQAAVHDVQHSLAQVLATTATAYWRYQGALQTLSAYRDAEKRATDMLESVRALASIDVVPRVQVQDALSNLSSRSVARIGQERAVAQARQELAQAMGTPAQALTAEFSLADPLPDVADDAPTTAEPGSSESLIGMGLANRADLRAAQARLEQQRGLLDGWRAQQRPQVDLVVGVGYSGAKLGAGVGAIVSPLRSPAGPSASVSLQYQFPHDNLEARGAALQAQAALEQQRLRTEDVRRQITSGVIVGQQNLKSAMQQFQEAGTGMRAAQAAHEGARDRLRVGVGSVLDSLQAEDRYISAVISRISAQVALASAIAELRYATGTFIHPEQSLSRLNHALFYKPFLSATDISP